MLDAIGRALVRMLITRRGLLEWVTADRAATTDASLGHRSAKDVAGAGARRGDRVLVVLTVAPGSLLLAGADPDSLVHLAGRRVHRRDGR